MEERRDSRETPLALVIRNLEAKNCGPREASKSQWIARCPVHDDRTPSLSVGEGDDGRALVDCHAGCETEAVISALGMTMRQLFPTNQTRPPPPALSDPSTGRQSRKPTNPSDGRF